MITAIELTNFKGAGSKPIRIPIAPVTLLFGANSAGKSTILHALHLAYEVLVNRNFDPDITERGGDGINLGGFRNFVHNRELNRKVILAFELDLSDTDLRTFGAPEDIDISGHVDTAKVEMTLGWSDLERRPMPECYRVYINGDFAAELVQPNGPKQGTFMEYEISHPIIKTLFGDNFDPEVDSWVQVQIADLMTVLPDWGRKLEYVIVEDNEYLAYGDYIASQVLVSIGEVFCEHLKKFRHIGPIREIIPRNFEGISSLPESRWYSGLGAWDNLLHSRETNIAGNATTWLHPHYRLNTGYGLVVYNSHFSERSSKHEDDQYYNGYPPMVRLINPDTKRLFTLQDVGVGMSQLIPVVVGALMRSTRILAVEQPELHIHPMVQTGLGDLFAYRANMGDCTFLIETHSEHLMLRLMRRVREAYEGELPEDAPKVNHKDISILFFESDKDEMKVTEIKVDETGEFTKRWPKGFFGERAEELF